MKPIKLVVFDIDGTLLPTGTDVISEDARIAIETLKLKGIQVMIATGRAFYLIPQSIKQAVNPDYYVAINGQCLLNAQGEIIHRVDISYDSVKKITALSKENNLDLAFIYHDALRAFHNYVGFYDFYSMGRDLSTTILDHSSLGIPTDELPMGFYIIGDEAGIQLVAKEVPEVTITCSMERGYDGFVAGVNKATAIDHACEYLNCTPEEVMVFGDGENDLEMLDYAGIAIVMGNAGDEIKKHADFVTESCDQQGISVGLKHYNLI